MCYCVYAIVFAAPFSKSIAEISIGLAIALWLVKKILNKDYSLVDTDLNLPFLIFIIVIIPSFLNSAYPFLSIKAFFSKMLKFVALYFVIVECVNTKSRLKALFVIAMLGMILIAIDGYFQYYTGVDFLHRYQVFKARDIYSTEGFFRGFPTASFPFPNDLAAWILLFFFPLICVTIFDLKNNWIKYVAAFLSIALSLLFFLTKTRGAWLGFAASMIYIALSKKKIWLILLLVLVFLIPFALKMEISQYILAFTSVGDRFDMWRVSWEIFKNHPIIGNGLNTFFANFKEYRRDEWRGKKGSYAHNCYLQMACDTGLIGLGGFLWVIYLYFISVIKALRKINDAFYNPILWGISIGIFAFLIHSFFDTNLYSLNLVTLFWVAIGASQSIIKIFEREPA